MWSRALKPRLEALAAARGGTLSIDLLMVSHIDDDHIRGIVDMMDEWRRAREDGRLWPFRVNELWHNSFERISGADPTQVTASVLASTGAPSLPELDLEEFGEEEEDEAERAARIQAMEAAIHVLAGVKQGATLRRDSDFLGIPRNSGFDGLVRPDVGPAVPFAIGDLTLHIAGPLEEQIEALRQTFAEQLPPEAVLAAYADSSVANLSSIVALASCHGKTILLTGDARGDYLLEGLEAQGLLVEGKLHVDILKMQHHGSDRNTKTEFFEAVTADHYVVSADGHHGNPDRATFEMLIEARGREAEYKIHLTHSVRHIDETRRHEWEGKRQRAIALGRRIPREWDSDRDDLGTLISAKERDSYRFTICEPGEGEGVRIELLDPIPC